MCLFSPDTNNFDCILIWLTRKKEKAMLRWVEQEKSYKQITLEKREREKNWRGTNELFVGNRRDLNRRNKYDSTWINVRTTYICYLCITTDFKSTLNQFRWIVPSKPFIESVFFISVFQINPKPKNSSEKNVLSKILIIK